jgi:hypothetical protein
MPISGTHKIITVLFGLLLLLATRNLSYEKPAILVNAAVLAAFLAALSWYNYWLLKKMGKYNVWVFLRPLLLVLSGLMVLLVIPGSLLKVLFLLAFVAFVAAAQLFLGNFSENVVLNETLVTVFGFMLAMFAVREYFASRLMIAVVGTFLLIFLSTRALYESIPKSERIKLVSAGSIALFCSQIFWAMSLLPYHYSALAILLLNVFYFCAVLNYYAFFHVLNAKKIYFHVSFLVACSAIILLFTPWNTRG